MPDEVTKERLLEQLREIAKEIGSESVPRHEFLRRTGISERQMYNLFGSYNELVKAAGLQPNTFPTSDAPKYSDKELMDEIIRVLRLPSSKLTRLFFDQNSIGGKSSAVERRFGGWINAIRTVLTMLDPVADEALIGRTQAYLSPQGPMTSIVGDGSDKATQINELETIDQDEHYISHELLEGNANLYGDFINFRGLQHAPVNEQGVVFLFGMICKELGYVVEIIKQGFPDCEAKRRIRGKSGMWQRVRIEFEFQSRSFRTHGHDPDQCDMIICWEDNWPDCPIEVLELRNSLKNISAVDKG